MRVVLLVSALLVALSSAWAPASHYYFTCSAAGVPLDECLTSHPHLLSGTEMPDAFGFVNLLSPLGVPVPCQGWNLLALHSPLFAGYLYQGSAKFNTPTFNATAFAIGFGMHVTADAAGFYDGGYLGYGWGHSYTPLINNTANWLALWPFMEAVDAHVFKTYFQKTNTHLPLRGVPSATLETATFIVETVGAAIANGTTFPGVDTTTVQQCAAAWQSMIAEESKKVEATPSAAYEFVMTYNDRYGATTADQAIAHFNIVQTCAIAAPQQWLAMIRDPSYTPLAAVEGTIKWIENAYAAGQCSPTPPVSKLPDYMMDP